VAENDVKLLSLSRKAGKIACAELFLWVSSVINLEGLLDVSETVHV